MVEEDKKIMNQINKWEEPKMTTISKICYWIFGIFVFIVTLKGLETILNNYRDNLFVNTVMNAIKVSMFVVCICLLSAVLSMLYHLLVRHWPVVVFLLIVLLFIVGLGSLLVS